MTLEGWTRAAKTCGEIYSQNAVCHHHVAMLGVCHIDSNRKNRAHLILQQLVQVGVADVV